MRSFSFLILSAVLACESLAAKIVQLSDVIPIDGQVAVADLLAADKTNDSPMLQHYGHPPDGCEKDEAALQIQSKMVLPAGLFRIQKRNQL